MNAILIFSGILVALVVIIRLGLAIKPKPFAPLQQPQFELPKVPLPAGLPAPVQRFYTQVYGEQIPVIHSAVISGWVNLRPVGPVAIPSRFRFIYDAGQGYRHYIEGAIFGIPVLKIHETYLDGQSKLDLPFGMSDQGPKVDQAANMGLWAESVWLPALYLTDSRARWEAIDEETALLWVPFGEAEQQFVVRFNPKNGLLQVIESMRYHGSEWDHKTLWLNRAVKWGRVNGYTLPTYAEVTWFDDGKPWALFTVEEVVYNVDVSKTIHAMGP